MLLYFLKVAPVECQLQDHIWQGVSGGRRLLPAQVAWSLRSWTCHESMGMPDNYGGQHGTLNEQSRFC